MGGAGAARSAFRFDTNDYSLDPGLVGRRVEVRVDQREVIAVVLDTGELACRHERVFAKHRTITALEHAARCASAAASARASSGRAAATVGL